ncbi:NeuD/PglB/VioB family sugar acetyltransferase [Aquirufa sp. KTFRIE-69F]|uniref:NeuD/PglB/VioB family sugar acetyltransferase n=1 Tax=Aquirufa originis TaxID=3096514 RepID=A0ABW6D5Y7_9BACT
MKLAIIGAGGHAKEVYHSIMRCSNSQPLELAGFFVEPEYVEEGSKLYEFPIRSIEELNKELHLPHIAVGKIDFRFRLFKNLKDLGFIFATIIDPKSIVGNSDIQEGSYIASGAIVTADVRIGKCCIINSGAIVSHECVVDDFCNISPGVVLCGNVRVGERSLIGAGSLVREKTWIRDNVTLGMGSIVTKNILEPGSYIIHGSVTKKL